jgi:SAM-dependent methyltransferase
VGGAVSSRRARADEEYDLGFVDRLEMLWGEGFLSPGGAEGVRSLLRATDLTGRRVLDWGSGTGGAALLMASELGAREVVGIDVVPQLVARAQATAARRGIANVGFSVVQPGPLPFPDACHDVVFSKDSLLHVADKDAAIAEIFRVLAPGGVFVGSDWLAGPEIDRSPAWTRFIAIREPSFHMVDAAKMVRALQRAGLRDLAIEERDRDLARAAQDDLARVEGPLAQHFLSALGERGYREWLEIRRCIAEAARTGALRPTAFRAVKPL